MGTRSSFAPVVRDPHLRTGRHRGPLLRGGYRALHAWELPFPEFPAFTHINDAQVTADHVLEPHRHPRFELCFIVSGAARWSVGGHQYRLRAGDFFLTWPGEIHAGRPDPLRPQRNFAVGIDPRQLPTAAGSAGADLLAGLTQLEAQPDRLRVVHGGQGADRLLTGVLRECDAAHAAAPVERALCLAQVQAQLVELLVLLCRCALRQRAGAADLLPGLEDWLRPQLHQPPAVGAMAAWAGCSPARLTTRCRAAFGCTPLELVTRMRIAEAARRLAADPHLDVTRIALDLGFCSSQYFATVFRRSWGTTPSHWQASQARR